MAERGSCHIRVSCVIRDSGACILQLLEQNVHVATSWLMIMFSINKSCFIIELLQIISIKFLAVLPGSGHSLYQNCYYSLNL